MKQMFKINLSSGSSIPLDEDELQDVIDKLPLGQFIKVRQGLFNTSYFVSLVVDQERKDRYYKERLQLTDGYAEPELLIDVFEKIKTLPNTTTKMLNEK